MVTDSNNWPDFNSVAGKCGVLGELGKRCVSKQSAACFPSLVPPFPTMLTSSRLPVVRNNSVRLDSYRQVTPKCAIPVVHAETRFSVQPAAVTQR